MISSKPYSASTSAAADQAADSAEGLIRSTQRATNEALDNLTSKVHEVHDKTAPVLNRLSERAEQLARRGIDAVRDGSYQVRDKAAHASDLTVSYIKDEPVKAILIAAAAGAALMALVSLLSRPRDR